MIAAIAQLEDRRFIHKPRRSPMGTASLRSRGPTCSGTASAAAWLRQCSPSATERSGSGPRCVTSSLPPASNAAGSTRSPTSSTRSPSPHSPARRPRWPRSGTPKTAGTPRPLPAPSWPSTAPSGPGRTRRSPTTSTCCWSSTTTPPSTGSTCVPRTGRVDLRHRPPSAAGHQGPGSRAAGVAMAFKLIESAQQRWRAVNAPHLIALVRAGARFEKGLLVERPDESGGDQ